MKVLGVFDNAGKKYVGMCEIRITMLWGHVIALATLRTGMYFNTLQPTGSVRRNSTLVAWVNGGPVSPVSYLIDGALQVLADSSGLPIAYFDFCGVGKSSCRAASDWEELQEQVAEFLNHVKTSSNASRVIVTTYSAGSLTTPVEALQGVAAVVYLSPITDLQSSLISRRMCMREIADTFVTWTPADVTTQVGLVLCGLHCTDGILACARRTLLNLSWQGYWNILRLNALRSRVLDGYVNALMQNAHVSPACTFVAFGAYDRVMDKNNAISFHGISSGYNDTLVILKNAGHFPVKDECEQCTELATLYNVASARC
tara:strand:+ start:8505 stop:9449 length:945 start_codon:yes stop_codon:yes gene_type:complete